MSTSVYYIFLGVLPSIIWLLFYLRKDKNPEPNSTVLRLFLMGVLISPLAVILEFILIGFADPSIWSIFAIEPTTTNVLTDQNWYKVILISALIPALVEEYLKYSGARFKFIKNSDFDEPVDVMLYCIITALGFAAVENLLVLFGLPQGTSLNEAVGISGLRFLGATLVHALASGMAGYFLALGLLNFTKRYRYIFTGLFVAILFHACYNYLIELISSASLNDSNMVAFYLYGLVALIILMASVVSGSFLNLKKLSSVCKIKANK